MGNKLKLLILSKKTKALKLQMYLRCFGEFDLVGISRGFLSRFFSGYGVGRMFREIQLFPVRNQLTGWKTSRKIRFDQSAHVRKIPLDLSVIDAVMQRPVRREGKDP